MGDSCQIDASMAVEPGVAVRGAVVRMDAVGEEGGLLLMRVAPAIAQVRDSNEAHAAVSLQLALYQPPATDGESGTADPLGALVMTPQQARVLAGLLLHAVHDLVTQDPSADVNVTVLTGGAPASRGEA